MEQRYSPLLNPPPPPSPSASSLYSLSRHRVAPKPRPAEWPVCAVESGVSLCTFCVPSVVAVCVSMHGSGGESAGWWSTGCLVVSHCPSCVQTVGGVHWFLLLAEQKPVSSLRPSPALSGLAAAAMAAAAAQHCVCVCVIVVVVVVQPTVWASTRAAQSVDGIVRLCFLF